MKHIAAIILFCFLSSILSQAQEVYHPIDAGSKVGFVIKNFRLKTEGSFTGLKGRIYFSPANPAGSDITVSVDAASINTGNNLRDKDLKEEKYFDLAHHPLLKFKSSRIKALGGDRFNVAGNLSIKGITRPLQFDFTAKPKDGGYLLEGSFGINRLDYKVGSSSISLQDNLQVHLSVLAKK